MDSRLCPLVESDISEAAVRSSSSTTVGTWLVCGANQHAPPGTQVMQAHTMLRLCKNDRKLNS